jgi:Tfp pilus assembly protein PilP
MKSKKSGSQSLKKNMERVKGLTIFILTISLLVFCVQAEEVNKTDTDGVGTNEKQPFDPTISRDPFKPFIRVFGKKGPGSEISKSIPPIKRYTLTQFRLAGIIWVGQLPRAMVVDPEKNTYVLGIGEEIGSKQGKIVEIKDNGIMVEEKIYPGDVIGQKKIETVMSFLAFTEE